MKIGIIQASSQAGKNRLIFDTVKKYAAGAEVINFGCREGEPQKYSYIEISVLAGLLLSSGAVDFIVTGCSSGQGMMLACNSFPGVLCGYAPTPMDAYLFAQINNGNAVSLPLGEGYTWAGEDNLEQTLKKLFSEPIGQGYPKNEAARKLRDTVLLKEIRAKSQTTVTGFLDSLAPELRNRILSKQDVTGYIRKYGKCERITEWVRRQEEERDGKTAGM
jgi:ribose 5-phosphate isomerase RpiB